MKITKRQLRRIIKESYADTISQAAAQSRAREKAEFTPAPARSATEILADLHEALDELIGAIGFEEAALELSGIAEELRLEARRAADLSEGILREAYAQPPEIESYLKTHGLEAGIDYDFGGDGVRREYYLIALRLDAEELASMLDDEMYPDSPIRGRDLGTSSGPDGDYVTW